MLNALASWKKKKFLPFQDCRKSWITFVMAQDEPRYKVGANQTILSRTKKEFDGIVCAMALVATQKYS